MRPSLRHSRRNATLTMEWLEDRRVLATSVSLDAVTGVLSMLGDGNDNVATVQLQDPETVEVTLSGAGTFQFSRADVSSLFFSGGRGNDTFTNTTDIPSEVYGHAGADWLYGGSGNDVIIGGPGPDFADGGDGDDLINGGTEPDQLFGGAGNDEILGDYGDDELDGGSGDDLIIGYYGDDIITGGPGNDTLFGFSGNDLLDGGDGDDAAYGQHGVDEVYGRSGNDTLGGGPADDFVYGGDDDDLITGDQGNDSLFGEDGHDTLIGWIGDDVMYGGAGNDNLYAMEDNDVAYGEAGDDTFVGGSGDDLLYGGDGNDTLFGSDGDDVLRGGSGVDRLSGQGGADSLLAGALAGETDYLNGGGGSDRFLTLAGDLISDFVGEDAELVFVNETSTWNEAELETADRAFQRLFDATGNTRLLRETLNDDPLTFYKMDSLGGFAGLNRLSWMTESFWTPNGWETITTYTREIQIADWNETSAWQDDQWVDVFVHEIGHNWDSELELTSANPDLAGAWGGFLAIADWRDYNPGLGFTQSHDGQWWYDSDAYFHESYGRTNPNEDLATAWEYWFENWQDPGQDHTGMESRMVLLDSVFAALA